MSRKIAPDSTNESMFFYARNRTTGLPATVTSATAGLLFTVQRGYGAPTDSSLESITDLASAGAAHSDWALKEVAAGRHRLCLPDAIFASGVEFVHLMGAATNVDIVGEMIEINLATVDELQTATVAALKTAIPPIETQYKATVVSATDSQQFVVSITDIDGNAVDESTLASLAGKGIVVVEVQGGSGTMVGDTATISSTTYSAPDLAVTLNAAHNLDGTPVAGDIMWISPF